MGNTTAVLVGRRFGGGDMAVAALWRLAAEPRAFCCWNTMSISATSTPPTVPRVPVTTYTSCLASFHNNESIGDLRLDPYVVIAADKFHFQTAITLTSIIRDFPVPVFAIVGSSSGSLATRERLDVFCNRWPRPLRMQRLQLEVRLTCELVQSVFAGRIGFTGSVFSSSAPTTFERTIYPDGLSILTHQAACCTPQLFVGGWISHNTAANLGAQQPNPIESHG